MANGVTNEKSIPCIKFQPKAKANWVTNEKSISDMKFQLK